MNSEPLDPAVGSHDALLTEAIRRLHSIRERLPAQALREPDAAVLATVSRDGQPAARVVLVKNFDERGFAFFTNSHSRKGSDLLANPLAAICFHWDCIAEQVRVEGTTQFTTDAESDDYWDHRPRESQLGAWASLQSEELTHRSELERRFNEFELKFQGVKVPRPAHWRGYRLVPIRIEFWIGRPSRLHDREVYELRDGNWKKLSLYP